MGPELVWSGQLRQELACGLRAEVAMPYSSAWAIGLSPLWSMARDHGELLYGMQVDKLDYVRAGEPQMAWDPRGFEVSEGWCIMRLTCQAGPVMCGLRRGASKAQ